MKGNALENLYRQLMQQAKADPRKATVLGVLIVIMAFFIVKAGSSSSPAVASANVPRAINVADNLRHPPKANTAVAALLKWADRPIPPALSRNLFAVNYDYFPQDGTKPVAAPRIPHGDGFWDQLAKSMASRADHKLEHDVLLENAIREAAALKIQSTMMGAVPTAIINGELVRAGDVVASFCVLKIEARRIVLERTGIKLERRLD